VPHVAINQHRVEANGTKMNRVFRNTCGSYAVPWEGMF